MSIFIVDVEADGPCPGLYSMISFGVVKVTKDLKTTPTFYGETAPISDKWVPGALAVSNITREQFLTYPKPEKTINDFVIWLRENTNGKAVFMSDNPAFDWQFMNYYLHAFYGDNPFGFSARRIGDFYAGLTKDFHGASKWKNLRKTKHTHHPVDDSLGNAEALLAMCDRYGVRLNLD